MKLKQFRVGTDNFSYLIISPSKESAIVDPGYNPNEAMNFVISNGLKLEFVINTHYHSDHSYGGKIIKTKFPNAKLVASREDGIKLDSKVDIFVFDKDQLRVGDVVLDILLTPGHTRGSLCIIVDKKAILTGDTLFIGDCGRTDLSSGNPFEMYHTLKEIIMKLPNDLIVYPGHDYGDKPFDSLGNQKQINKTLLAKTFDDFSKIP